MSSVDKNMPPNKEDSTKEYYKFYISFFLKKSIQYILLATIVGLICGCIGILFRQATGYASRLFVKYKYLIFLLPVSGVIIVFLYDKLGLKNDKGTNTIIEAIRNKDFPKLAMAPLIFVSTFLTHICGGSSGREGASLQIGGSIGANIGKLFRLRREDVNLLIMCGMSAVFSAVFGTPIAATLISMEIASIGIWHYSALLPCIISSVIAYGLTGYFGVDAEVFKVVNIPNISWLNGGKVVILAIFCAIVCILFTQSIHISHKIAARHIKNSYIRIIVGGLIIIALTFLSFSNRYNGTGMRVIEDIFSGGKVMPYDFIMKIIFTAVTIGFGFKGGEIVPAFFVGATFGGFFGPILGLSPQISMAIGMVSIFCGAVNCPITAILLGVELFGIDGMIYFALSCAICYVFSGYFGLYDSQKFVYSKVQPVYIDKIVRDKK